MDYKHRLAEFRARYGTRLDRWVFREEQEIIDLAPDSAPALRVLRDLDRFNRLHGLHEKLIRRLETRLHAVYQEVRRPLRVLEVCCGQGGFCRALASWSKRRGVPVQITGIDNSAAAIDDACRAPRAKALSFDLQDATRLPYADRAFDLAVNIQSLHHFGADAAIALLREWSRVARAGLLYDVRRTPVGFLVMQFLRPFFSREFVHDAAASHRRAYSLGEARFLLRSAGIDAQVRPFDGLAMLIECAGD